MAANVNQKYFNEEAANYDAKHSKLNERLTREIQDRLDFIGVDWVSTDDEDDEAGGKPKKEVRLLDYACGTGMMSRALAPYTTQCVGIDISENMVAAYNKRAEDQGLSPSEMHAIVGDLAVASSDTIAPALSAPEYHNFDIAVVGGGFHHMDNPSLAAKRLADRLKPGGVLMIWDFAPHGAFAHSHHHHHHSHAPPQDASHTVMHHGFGEEAIRGIFEDAGAGADFGHVLVGGGFLLGHQTLEEGGAEEEKKVSAKRRQVFFARGAKRG
ncbi:S-adenosyl-L-methionine-dependent methyltransferase [Xylariomycetidae sp. FL0641]|nr:S-adenosyl-L-methionine-dependent methyltransferase [Xylariomycetidae sp. FL0641]